MRNLDNTYTMSDWDGDPPDEFGAGEYHKGSQIFSGALWDLRQQLGQSIADVLSFEGLDNLDQTVPDFLDGRDAIIAADYDSFGGTHVNTIKNVFSAHEIPPPPSPPTNLYISGNIGGYARVNWTASARGAIDYYKVYRRTYIKNFNVFKYRNSSSYLTFRENLVNSIYI